MIPKITQDAPNIVQRYWCSTAAGPCRPLTSMTTNGASARGAGSLSNTRRQNRSNGGSKTAKSAAAH